MKGTISSAAVTALLIAGSAAATTTVIDFDNLDSSTSQTIPLLTFTEDGFTFALTSFDSETGSNAGPAIFDTTLGAGTHDLDLQAPNGGTGTFSGPAGSTIADNVLILQSDTSGNVGPDDDRDGGAIQLTLLDAPGEAFTLDGVSVLDDGFFSVFTEIDGTVSDLLGFSILTSENEVGFIDVAAQNQVLGIGDSIILDFNEASGAFDSIQLTALPGTLAAVTAVPLPPALPLMLMALGGLGAMRWRRTSKA